MSVRVMCLEATQILMVVLFKRGQCMNKTQAIEMKESIIAVIPGPNLESYDYIAPNAKTTMYTSPCKTLFFMLIL